ncbi:MAG: DUF3467 domain-containing protein [Anaerolineae bacterium]|nr:DUF3467 domain-containing protein [Anaerolineae bacterium]MDQ7033815.1 DUF3467 domain-containing protein [Anaerolineae bacterium]
MDREEVLNEAIDLTQNQISYATNIRFTVSNNDVTLDFYRSGSNPKNPNGDPIAYRIHRIIIPPSLAKDISGLLANAMSNWEETFGVSLPIAPDENNNDGEG